MAQYQLQLNSVKAACSGNNIPFRSCRKRCVCWNCHWQVRHACPQWNQLPGLCEVFNILPGTVNQCRGVTQYHSQDQPFSFQKQVKFENNTSSPELKPKADQNPLSNKPTDGILPELSKPSTHPQTSMQFSAARTLPCNRTFDVSHIAPLTGNPQDAATIAA